MLNLIWKDIMVQRHEKTVVVGLVIALLNTYTVQAMPAVCLMTMILTVYLLVVYANAFDYKYNGDVLVNSLPVSRSTVVTAKFVSVYLYYGAVALLTLLLGLVFRALHVPTIDRVLGLNLIVLGLFFLSVYYTVFFPLYFKLGYMKARWVNYLALIAMFGVAGSIYGLTGTEVAEDVPSVAAIIDLLLGNAGARSNAVLIVIAAVLIGIAFVVSRRIYAQKEF